MQSMYLYLEGLERRESVSVQIQQGQLEEEGKEEEMGERSAERGRCVGGQRGKGRGGLGWCSVNVGIVGCVELRLY